MIFFIFLGLFLALVIYEIIVSRKCYTLIFVFVFLLLSMVVSLTIHSVSVTDSEYQAQKYEVLKIQPSGTGYTFFDTNTGIIKVDNDQVSQLTSSDVTSPELIRYEGIVDYGWWLIGEPYPHTTRYELVLPVPESKGK